MNDNSAAYVIGGIAIFVLVILGIVAICCPDCHLQIPAPPALAPASPAPVIQVPAPAQAPAPIPEPTPTPTPAPAYTEPVLSQPTYTQICRTGVQVVVFPEKVYLCRGESMTVTVVLTGKKVDPVVHLYLDGSSEVWKSFRVYHYSNSISFQDYLNPGWHTVKAVATIPGCAEGSDTTSFEVKDCYRGGYWSTPPCCCYSGCGTCCPTCPSCHGNPPPTEEPCPPGSLPPPPPGETPGQTPTTPTSGGPVNRQLIP